jgi:hypothetical protein
MEFISAPLSSDKGLEAIRHFCRQARTLGFEVDRRCGLHVHLDVTQESIANVKSIAYGFMLTAKLWGSFVSAERRENRYCWAIRWTREQLERLTTAEEFTDFCWSIDRYTWVNLASYRKHRTIELRLHSATLNADKITNWVKALCRFADFCALKTWRELETIFDGDLQAQFNALAGILRDDSLALYLADRTNQFGACIVAPVRA